MFTTRIALAAAALAVTCAMAEAETIRFSTAGPAPDFLAKSLESFATKVADADVGVEVEVYPGSSLFRQGTEVPAIQRGNLEMSTMTTFEIAAQLPEWGFLNRAYLFRDYDHMMSVMEGPVGDALKEAVADGMGIEILAVAYLGTREVNLREARDVSGPADLDGVKMRMPASPEWLLLGDTLGVEPTPMAMPEVYVALQTGAIDGQENPLTITNAAKFWEVTQQIVLTDHLVQPVFYAIGKDFWDGLSDEQKQAVATAAVAAADENNKGRRGDEMTVAATMKDKGLRVDEIDLTPFRDNADAIYADAPLAEPWNKEMMAEAMK
ncbi:TRAP transporter substrate-binding protein DctP [Acuticoccus mangrovi]|uniref:TRAP transporter substrate-binding protein DctP n=1 Tax=Acuticoccus mangrovi TaxID=2796142 RepID=A0A934MCB4_9HYPH|nr:TRAP transporter substrate-binding protein DctP [Acuticoccus mangrovi]MBJ3775092.1 TRAP transporter substrate-binding protein DctP [Acuticoccus mangrovi]